VFVSLLSNTWPKDRWPQGVFLSTFKARNENNNDIARQNFEHYRKLLATEGDETRRHTLLRLLAGEVANLTALESRRPNKSIHTAVSTFGTSGHSAPASVRFWTIADKAGIWRVMVCPLVTKGGH
jgi:hypothetical protein